MGALRLATDSCSKRGVGVREGGRDAKDQDTFLLKWRHWGKGGIGTHKLSTAFCSNGGAGSRGA